ncbi:RNA polymerase sigma factor sigma-70 region 4 domain-containing protein [Cellulosilyticum ruminicola]|uniref:hypothetical protein n=1 Tax=Cellulosilyticum ruminicola TaxID=425254 RepID=UPI0006CF4BBF|nr:hypothetical protein [Cellulosilyticum ruminicola]
MGNPLQRFFKKIFTGAPKKAESAEENKEEQKVESFTQSEAEISIQQETVIEIDTKAVSIEVKDSTQEEKAISVEENAIESVHQQEVEEDRSLKIADYIVEEDARAAFEAEGGLVERLLAEYIPAKVYEEKLISELQKQGVMKTSQITSGVVAFMLDYASMNESKIKNLLKKFKGYVYFKAVEKLFTQEEWDKLKNTLDWHIHMSMQPEYASIKIKDAFKEHYYEPLWKLAKIKGISELRELTTAFLVSYKNYTGVGEKKYKKTLEVLAGYTMKDNSFECLGIVQKEKIADGDYKIHIEEHLYNIFQNYNLAQVSMIYGDIVANGIKKMKLKNLQGKSMNIVSGLVYRPVLEEAIQKLNKVVTPNLAFKSFKDEKGLELLRLRYVERVTLEEAAQQLGLSLEETSKLQIGTVDQLTELIRSSKLVEILSFINKGDDHIAFNIIENVLGEQNSHIVELIKHNAFQDLGYHPIFNMVFLHEVVGEDELMENLKEVLPEVFLLNEYKAKMEEAIVNIGIKKFGKDVIPNLLEAMGYHASGKLYSKKEMTGTYILEMIFKSKVKKPLYLDEDAVEILNEEAQKMYNYVLGNSLIAIEQIIKQVEDVLCVGSNTYLHSSRIKCKKEVLNEIQTYLVELSETTNEINANVLYETLKTKLKGTSIKDQYGLYHIIFYYFKDQFKKDNNGGLNIILREDKKSYGEFIGFTEVVPRLQQLINKHMDQGYIKIQEFFEEIQKEERLSTFLHDNKLVDSKEIGKVLMHVDDTLLGDEVFLYRTSSPYKSLEELMAAEVV